MLRPLLEYCAPVFHPMLTDGMSQRLESLQRRALQIIYGFDRRYEDILAITGLEKLDDRREKACLAFANKLVQSERFKVWFPEVERDGVASNLRSGKKYQEKFARSHRLYHSPLFYMRRLLNQAEYDPLPSIRSLYTN